MPSYNWKDYASATLWERYIDAPLSEQARLALEQAQTYGRSHLQRARLLAREFGQPEPDELEFMLELLLYARADPSPTHFAPTFSGTNLFDGLIALRGSADWGANESRLRCPRIFVSHRQQDYPEALRIAKIATEHGFQFWLDILDPTLTWLTTVGPGRFGPRQYQLLVAVVIEMALLHCSHVIAVMTPQTTGSGWVPYEYGRVKDSSIHSLQAGCWIHPALGGVTWDYLLLGVETRSEGEIGNWLTRERNVWRQRYNIPDCDQIASDDWQKDWGDPGPLPRAGTSGAG